MASYGHFFLLMKITLPEGYEMPENARPGEAFEAVISIRPDDDGGFTMLTIDGMPMAEEEEMNESQKFAAAIPLPWNEE